MIRSCGELTAVRTRGAPSSDGRGAGGEAAWVEQCHPHRFRHSLATALLRRGVRLEVVQRILGHVSITTTMAYTRLSDAETIRALKMPLR